MYLVIKMVDGFIVYQIVKNLNEKIKSGKIQKIYQINDNEILFKLRAHKVNYQMITSIDSHDFRVALTNKEYATPEKATNFTMLLRKHLEGGIIDSIEQVAFDRVIVMKIKKLNEIKDLKDKYLIIELLGRHANLILCDQDYKIIQTQKSVPFSIDNERVLQPKLAYPFIKQTKANPLESFTIVDNYSTSYQGFSKKMSEYFLNSEDPQKLLQEMLDGDNIYYDGKNISLIPDDKEQITFNDIDEAFDYLYDNADQKSTKQNFQATINDIKTIIKKNNRKLKKLATDYENNLGYEQNRYYGTLIFDNIHLINPDDHLDQIKVMDYDKNEEVVVKLDKKLSLKENASAYLKKYHKQKDSFRYIEEQSEITKQNNNILTLALDQLSFANVDDAQEIIDELVNIGMIKRKQLMKNKKKTKKPQYETYRYHDTKIYLGKNNIQNDYVTFKLANKNDTWLHIHGYAGSHVVIDSPQVDDALLQVAGMLAIKYSSVADKKARYQVDYTLVKNVKKIRGKILGQVTFSEHESLEVNYDETLFKEIVKEQS